MCGELYDRLALYSGLVGLVYTVVCCVPSVELSVAL